MSELSLSLEAIRIDGGTQPRAMLNEEHIEDLIQALTDGAILPPITVFYDGADYWLADGFHRYHATKRLYQKSIQADVRQGTRRDAVLFSVGANAQHGLKRTNADKRRAVETLLNDSEWAGWSNREIARRCGVDEGTVRNLRPNFTAEFPQLEPRTYTNKYGDVAVMKMENIGRSVSSNVLRGFGQTLVNLEAKPTLPVLPVTPQPIKEPSPVAVEVRECSPEAPLPVVEYSPVLYTPPAQAYTPVVEPVIARGVPAALQMSESNEWYTPRLRAHCPPCFVRECLYKRLRSDSEGLCFPVSNWSASPRFQAAFVFW